MKELTDDNRNEYAVRKNQCFQQSRKKRRTSIFLFCVYYYKFSLHPNVLYVLLCYDWYTTYTRIYNPYVY